MLVALLLVLVLPRGDFGIMSFAVIAVYLVMNRLRSKRVLVRAVAAGIVGLLLVSTTATSGRKITARNLSGLLTFSAVTTYLTVDQFDVHSGASRALFYPLTFVNLHEYAKTPLLGFGPGMYGSYIANRLMPESNKLIYDVFNQSKLGYDSDTDSQIIPLWGELGYVGIGLTLLLLATAALHFSRLERSATLGLLSPSFAATARIATIYTLCGLYFNHFLEIQPIHCTLAVFWALATANARAHPRAVPRCTTCC